MNEYPIWYECEECGVRFARLDENKVKSCPGCWSEKCKVLQFGLIFGWVFEKLKKESDGLEKEEK